MHVKPRDRLCRPVETEEKLIRIESRTLILSLEQADERGANINHGLEARQVANREVTGALDETMGNGEPVDARSRGGVFDDHKVVTKVEEGGRAIATEDQGERVVSMEVVEAIGAHRGGREDGLGRDGGRGWKMQPSGGEI